MTSSIKNDIVYVDCDGPGCHVNFESNVVDSFRKGWAEAQDAGWVNAQNNDDTWSHYCPKCKHIVGD